MCRSRHKENLRTGSMIGLSNPVTQQLSMIYLFSKILTCLPKHRKKGVI